jgi:integrase
MRAMLLLGLNCGFGPKDIEDLRWEHVSTKRITLPRSKTGVVQTFSLWPESQDALGKLKSDRTARITRLARRGRARTDHGFVFITRFWQPWNKDSVAREFRKLCCNAKVCCYGFYRLRHSASTAVSLVASPHVQRRFMRHSRLQQQVTYTHVPDAEVDVALMKAREKLLGTTNEDPESDQGSDEAA